MLLCFLFPSLLLWSSLLLSHLCFLLPSCFLFSFIFFLFPSQCTARLRNPWWRTRPSRRSRLLLLPWRSFYFTFLPSLFVSFYFSLWMQMHNAKSDSASPRLGSELFSSWRRTISGPAACPTLRKALKCGGNGLDAIGIPQSKWSFKYHGRLSESSNISKTWHFQFSEALSDMA